MQKEMVPIPTGKIVFLLRTANNALPITNGSITVENESGNIVFYEFLNPSNSGLSREAVLETPPKALSLDSEDKIRPYAVYNVIIRAEGNYRMEIFGVQLFEDITTQLPIQLVPLPQGITNPDDAELIIIRIPEHILSNPNPPPFPQNEPIVPLPAINIAEGIYIPETVTVHLGAPDENATNVTVGFIDYIKNVASSEIYPTWPRESLRANITAQISLTLNRIFTEWYRSRGYDFDITNSTAFDQAFVYGRNIYEEISNVVDEIFNEYLTRPNNIEPLFASYCNGTTTTCAGLSQWGTVALAESGQSREDILGFYYGDIIINETDDIRTPEESYPGFPLSEGSEGEDVRILQEQLNRIAINYPQLPLITVSGIYGSSTANTVREFQRLFILPQTGVTDRATWYRVSQIYSSVKRLSELTSEGQRASYNQQLYPGTPLSLYSRGSGVQEIQFYLQRINQFNSAVESPVLDGIYGAGTERAVRSFQRAYGLAETGVVEENTWNRLVEIYNGTLDNVEEPSNGITPVPYPGYILSPGSRGEYVRYIQQVLNVINDVFLTIPQLEEDGIFGSATRDAVNAFAVIFGFPQNGNIDEALWSKINSIYNTVARQCIFSVTENENTRDFPYTDFGIGSSGDDVRYIQERINDIYRAIPYIGQLTVDGLYGTNTAASVSALERIFGLAENGRVNQSVWILLNTLSIAIANGCLPTTQTAQAVFKTQKSEKQNIADARVSNLKELMKRNGINAGSGPLFGLMSRRALSLWQKENGLEPTGLPDYNTRLKLLEKQ